MALQATFYKKTFHFSFQARTSRGSIKHKDSWFLKIWDDRNPEVFGIGEAGPVPGLSAEKPLDVEHHLENLTAAIVKHGNGVSLSDPQLIDQLSTGIPVSVLMALETAILDLSNGGTRTLHKNEFIKGKSIPINGLVWMGGLDYMLQQVSIKIDEGFTCVKLKIGGINFEKELDILQFIRRKYFRDQITIRLDANGAFKPEQALYKLIDCSRYDVHSVEQPLKAGSPSLPELCRQSPVPVALDEELIGVGGKNEKAALLDRVKPAFLVLKPTLHGGFRGCHDWIQLAGERGIGWWITSALESNVGLNAIAQFAGNYEFSLPQGLGTGTIFSNNIPSPLEVNRGALRYNSAEKWDLSDFD